VSGVARRRVVAATIALAFAAGAPTARAEEGDTRYGLAPYLSAGAAVLTSPSPFPGFIGLTGTGVEILGEASPWGGFGRAEFLSSGNDGRWTALSFALGGSRRLFGDLRHLSLVARAGIGYQRWHASTGGCSVYLFVPNGCKNYVAPPPGAPGAPVAPAMDVNADALGLLGGVRLELPIRPVYIAFDASLSPMVAFDSPPGGIIALQLNLLVAFHDFRNEREATAPPSNQFQQPRRRFGE
jgi:hypothetical protein